MIKYTLQTTNKMRYHRESMISKVEITLIMILFYDSDIAVLNISIWIKFAGIYAISSPMSFHTIVSWNLKGLWVFSWYCS